MVVLDVDDMLDPFPVSGPAAQGNGVDFMCADLAVENEPGTLDAVRAVCRCLELFRKQYEFLGEPFHVRVALQLLVEDKAALPVERFQVALDARELVRLLARVGADIQEAVLLAALGEQG